MHSHAPIISTLVGVTEVGLAAGVQEVVAEHRQSVWSTRGSQPCVLWELALFSQLQRGLTR